MVTKTKISITIDEEIEKKLEKNKVNKSKLINYLLQEHYNGKEVSKK